MRDDNKFDFISLDITEDSIKKLEESKDFMLNNHIISKDFDINSWVDRSFYEKAWGGYTLLQVNDLGALLIDMNGREVNYGRG